jgi:exonuclease III
MTHRTIPTFNINGLYCDARQQMLGDFIYRNDLDIVFSHEVVNVEFRQVPGYQFHYNIVAKRQGTAIVTRDTKPITTLKDSRLGQQLQEYTTMFS